jgi:alkanesulfonate monooxygenase SsuD/methylene tetrahydromethanopterin reductase-like flavin-dependent oxidoreductase (luciferase family)
MNAYASDRPLFGLNIDPSADRTGTAFELARLADASGLDFVAVQDHPYNPAFLDTWTLLVALGMATERVHLLPNVLNLPLRPPAMLAKAAASLDVLTGGRVEVALGAGARTDAVAAYGGPRREAGGAVDALEEAIHIIRSLWDGAGNGPVSFDGAHYSVRLHSGACSSASPSYLAGCAQATLLR